MATINERIISATILSTTTAINLAHIITAGDSNAYTLDLTFSDVSAISGTCQLYFVLADGSTATRDASDGVTISGNKVSYLLTPDLYAQRGLICWVQFADSNLYTPLKISFSGIRIPGGTTPLAVTQPYPQWAADMVDYDIAIGTVTTLAEGESATASITGTVPDKALNLGIPVGATGAKGDTGAGVPIGGAAGQVLSKISEDDYDTEWRTLAGTGDVVGPAGAVAGNIPLLDATGKVLSDSGYDPADFAASSHDHSGVYQPVMGTDDNYITDAEKSALHSHANLVALAAVSGTNTGDQDLSGYSLTTHNHDLTYQAIMGTDDNYVTDAEKSALHGHSNLVALNAVSGTNTGDQDLSGYSLTSHAHTGTYEPANANIQNHISSTSNPHGVIGSQVVLTGYAIASSASLPLATDTTNQAIGKLAKTVDGIETLLAAI